MIAVGIAVGTAVGMIAVLYALAWAYVRRKDAEREGPAGALMVVLGSGGHTAEMLTLVRSLPAAEAAEAAPRGPAPAGMTYPRCYVVAETDALSASKALRLEGAGGDAGRVRVETVPRSREVGQSYLTSCLTTMSAMCSALPVVARHRPRLLLVNGPGTCLPLCVAARALSALRLGRTRVVYVESIARVRSLSLTGKLLHALGIADRLLVQWPELAERYRGAVYVGRLV